MSNITKEGIIPTLDIAELERYLGSIQYTIPTKSMSFSDFMKIGR